MDYKACSCGKPSETDFKHLGSLCDACFKDVIYRRCRKALKDSGWLERGQKVHLAVSESLQGRVLETLFKQVVKGLPLEYTAESPEVVVVGKTADDEAEEFLDDLFSGNINAKSRAINLFSNISEKEIQKFCEFEGIKGSLLPKSELRKQLDELEKKYPGTFFSLQKSRESFIKQ
jgi:hypothetical protein